MKLSAPTQIVFLISLVLGVLGLLTGFDIVNIGGINSFYMMTGGWALLTAGSLLKGL